MLFHGFQPKPMPEASAPDCYLPQHPHRRFVEHSQIAEELKRIRGNNGVRECNCSCPAGEAPDIPERVKFPL